MTNKFEWFKMHKDEEYIEREAYTSLLKLNIVTIMMLRRCNESNYRNNGMQLWTGEKNT